MTSRARIRAARRASWRLLESPVGQLLVAATAEGLALIAFEPDGSPEHSLRQHGLEPDPAGPGDQHCERACQQLQAYFAGRLERFELSLDLSAGSEFEQRVWRATAELPRGSVSTYGKLAQRIGAPLAARAVGGALGRNPLPLVIPCHRVLQQDGALGGFSAGPGLKRRLLELEGYLLPTLGALDD